MKRPIRNCVGIVIFAVAIAAAFFTQRVRIGDLMAEVSAPDLPEAVGYVEVKGIEAIEDVGGTKEVSPVVDEIVPPSGGIPPEAVTAPPPTPRDDDAQPTVEPPKQTDNLPELPAPSPEPPATFNLAVPFTSQAPFAVWDEMHGEACEEASIYMIAEFYKGTVGKIDPTVADAELYRLVAIENETFGYFEDTTAAETARLAKIAYGFSRVDLIENPTADQIKALIASGHPVIVPAAGRQLNNPNFTGDGPPYHMIVLRGYTETQFISNDPGTRRGEEYVYSVETIMTAMHDWNGGDVENGKKVVLVMYP